MIAFWGFCIWLAVYSFNNGKTERLGMVIDVDATPCGNSDYGTQDYPYGYIYQPLNSLSNAVCLKSCPSW